MKVKTEITVRYNPSVLERVIAMSLHRRPRGQVETDRLLASRFARTDAALRLDTLWIRAEQLAGVL